MNKKRKKAISPVIATVLLVGMVLVIGLIIFLWFRGFQQEAITKFGGTNVQLVCEDVSFEADYSGGILTLSNFGNVPVYQVRAKIFGDKSYSTAELEDFEGWPSSGLTRGSVILIDLNAEISGSTERIILVPVLLGRVKTGQKTYVCEDRHGKEIII